MMLDPKSMEKLAELKAELIAEEPTIIPAKKKRKKSKKKKKPEESQAVPMTHKRHESFAARNRRMIASHSNIARSYYSGEGNSLYTYSGGDVRPR